MLTRAHTCVPPAADPPQRCGWSQPRKTQKICSAGWTRSCNTTPQWRGTRPAERLPASPAARISRACACSTVCVVLVRSPDVHWTHACCRAGRCHWRAGGGAAKQDARGLDGLPADGARVSGAGARCGSLSCCQLTGAAEALRDVFTIRAWRFPARALLSLLCSVMLTVAGARQLWLRHAAGAAGVRCMRIDQSAARGKAKGLQAGSVHRAAQKLQQAFRAHCKDVVGDNGRRVDASFQLTRASSPHTHSMITVSPSLTHACASCAEANSS